mmetsp:Transcript_39979/g.76468  ORF Transcript_39979/g.76468 Transcript_39979/m.76468 type:complete len:284 (-) Transcript_39979:1742-2593(-)
MIELTAHALCSPLQGPYCCIGFTSCSCVLVGCKDEACKREILESMARLRSLYWRTVEQPLPQPQHPPPPYSPQPVRRLPMSAGPAMLDPVVPMPHEEQAHQQQEQPLYHHHHQQHPPRSLFGTEYPPPPCLKHLSQRTNRRRNKCSSIRTPPCAKSSTKSRLQLRTFAHYAACSETRSLGICCADSVPTVGKRSVKVRQTMSPKDKTRLTPKRHTPSPGTTFQKAPIKRGRKGTPNAKSPATSGAVHGEVNAHVHGHFNINMLNLSIMALSDVQQHKRTMWED